MKLIFPFNDFTQIVAEQRAVCSEGASSVIGEETTGRLHMASGSQTVVALCTSNMSSCNGDKSLNARLASTVSITYGYGNPSHNNYNNNARSASGGGGGDVWGGASFSSVVVSSSRYGGRVNADILNTTAIVGCDDVSTTVDIGSSSLGGGVIVTARGIDNLTSSYIGSSGVGPVTTNTVTGSVDDDVVHGTSRAVSSSHLLAGIMGSFNGSRPVKHRSLPGSPVLQRTNRTRVNSTREGKLTCCFILYSFFFSLRPQ